MFHTNGISVTSIILQMKSISPPALPILITAGFPIWSINGVEHPEPDLKLENSGHTTTSNPTVITFMQTQGPPPTQYGLKIGICVHCFWRQNWSWKLFCAICRECLREARSAERAGIQMRRYDEHNVRLPADGSSASLTAMTFRNNGALANRCLQRSRVSTIVTHLFSL